MFVWLFLLFFINDFYLFVGLFVQSLFVIVYILFICFCFLFQSFV